MGFSDYESALKMRDVLGSMIETVVNRIRPPERIGTLVSWNPWAQTADILFPGETETVRCKWSNGLGVWNIGGLVRVGGSMGSYRVTEIITGSVFHKHPALHEAQLTGGLYQSQLFAHHFGWVSEGMPAEGNTWGLGRWTNAGWYEDGRGYVELQARQLFFASAYKVYKFFLTGDTVDWQVLVPWGDVGVNYDVNFQLEIKADGNSFELRWRRTRPGGAWEPGGLAVNMWLHSAGWSQDLTYVRAEAADVAPTVVYGQVNGTKNEEDGGSTWKGPFFDSPRHILQHRTELNLMGGGVPVLTYSAGAHYLKWSQAFRAHVGVCDFTTTGYIDIGFPAAASTILTHGVPTDVSSFSSSATGIDMAYGGAVGSNLYYDPPLVGAGTTSASRFHLVGESQPFQVPSHWIKIATFDGRGVGVTPVRLGTGYELDYWRTPSLSGSWVNVSSPFASLAYRKQNGVVYFKGGVSDGTVDSTIFTLPAGFRPLETRRLNILGYLKSETSGAASTGTAHTHPVNINRTSYRLDITNAGVVATSDASSSNTWLSFDGVSFVAEQ